MNPLDLTGLLPLMAHSLGIPDLVIGLIDGPVAENHQDLARENLRSIPGRVSRCKYADSTACRHGTFIAGILSAKRGSRAPGICPGCTLLVRPVFSELDSGSGDLPRATPLELAWAIRDCIDQGARILNLSMELEEPSAEGDRKLKESLDYAQQKRAIVIAAAGNQGIRGASVLTRHDWVIPVVACDLRGKPAFYSNLASPITRKGVMAPGEKIVSLGSDGKPANFGGTSTATAFVTGATALLWSEAPRLDAFEIKAAITGGPPRKRRSVVPPLLNAWQAYQLITGSALSGRLRRFRRKAA